MRRTILGAALAASAGCGQPVVEWSDVSYGSPTEWAVRDSIPTRGTGNCGISLRTAGQGPQSASVWWEVRPDSSAVLLFMRQGPKTGQPVPIDTTDASGRGCTRPAPAIAVDPRTGYVYVAYFLEPKSGSGIFFSHSMDEMGFHDPVAIAYGKRASRADIAASGDRVVVAYEEPNADRSQIWAALSKSMGHIFESRIPVSGTNEIAVNPRIQLSGTELKIQWLERVQSDAAGKTFRRAARMGNWR